METKAVKKKPVKKKKAKKKKKKKVQKKQIKQEVKKKATQPITQAKTTEKVQFKLPKKDENEEEMFLEVTSKDFLGFSFNSRGYSDQLKRGIAKTKKLCAVSCVVKEIQGIKVMWMSHDFGFMGGSLGCAEGEKLTLGLEYGREHGIPVIIDCKSGGARMQEGTLSLMQMGKVSVAVQALKNKKIPFISICRDPTYGGVSASYAMQGDVRIGVDPSARIGFAGPAVILNTMFEMNQAAYDTECPQGFQTAEYVAQNGQLDLVIDSDEELEATVVNILQIIWRKKTKLTCGMEPLQEDSFGDKKIEDAIVRDYSKSRAMDRVQVLDVINKVFTGFIELKGDGAIGSDPCIRGGLALLDNEPCVVLGTTKGHNPTDMTTSNYGMASPAGYRVALRLMKMAEHFNIPLVTLIDTPGAYPSFNSEREGQSEALATNLLVMSGLSVPIVTLVVGEGGSGGALAIGMGNRIAMLSNAYYSVISPEGAASILGRYNDEKHKAIQFPKDCQALAKVQGVYADNLQKLGVIDTIIPEEKGETVANCPIIILRIKNFFRKSFSELQKMTPALLQSDRYDKFRSMGKFDNFTQEKRESRLLELKDFPVPQRRKRSIGSHISSRTLKYIADQIMNSQWSSFRRKQPSMTIPEPFPPSDDYETIEELCKYRNAKWILDNEGPDAVSKWLIEQKQVLLTDTTMRDAHQSLIATRMRTVDLLEPAEETRNTLKDLFSIEMWGGATFDVCFRFLKESPWERLRMLRKEIPNILFQMLLRGSNAVGYKSYPDNVIVRFVREASNAGMDVFRIFDCFNQLDQMQLAIDTVRECGKIAEVCICFSGNFLSPKEKIYTLDYFKDLAQRITSAGAHIICIKDMAGLLRPQMAKPIIEVIKSVSKLPLHYHAHNTSSASLTTCIEMAKHGCHVVDFATAAMADTTSQPSMNAFLSSMEGHPRAPSIDYLTLEKLDLYWSYVRTMYSPFESGLKCGTARVYEHQIPGGQYSNLIAQARSMGTFHKWNQILSMYRDVNLLFGDIIKVTPSSKVVGDMSLFLISKGLTVDDVRTRGEEFEYPASVMNLFMGRLGYPHHGLPKDIQKKIVKDQKPLLVRPGKLLPSVDFDAIKKQLEDKYEREITDEELISSVIYPEVFDKFITFTNEFGTKAMHLPTKTYFYGMIVGEKIELEVPNHKVKDNKEDPNGVTYYSVTLNRVGPLRRGPDGNEAMRTMEFDVNGETRRITIQDLESLAIQECEFEKADPDKLNEIGSPLPGTVERIYLKVGTKVKKGTKIMSVSAMKMEVQVVATCDGTIQKYIVEIGNKVDLGTLLVVLG